jgi:hypothetical protein
MLSVAAAGVGESERHFFCVGKKHGDGAGPWGCIEVFVMAAQRL